jgi:hypothetical protein
MDEVGILYANKLLKGIETILTIKKDHAYLLRTRHLVKEDKIVFNQGPFTWENNGQGIRLKGPYNKSQRYFVGENQLVQLNARGQKITGALAEKYILRKTPGGSAVSFSTPADSDIQNKLSELHPSSDYWDKDNKNIQVDISSCAPNRKFAVSGDRLYMLDDKNNILWVWSTGGAPIEDMPIMDSKGTIFLIATDLIHVALDSSTGKVKWRCDGTTGNRAYSQIELYKDDIYFVVIVDVSDLLLNGHPPDKSYLCLWKGDSMLWETEIPATEVQVDNEQVFYTYKANGKIMKQAITIPKSFLKAREKCFPVKE